MARQRHLSPTYHITQEYSPQARCRLLLREAAEPWHIQTAGSGVTAQHDVPHCTPTAGQPSAMGKEDAVQKYHQPK